MFTIPFQISETEFSIMIVLQDENIERMKEYDPAELSLPLLSGPFLNVLDLRDIIISYATADDYQKVTELCRRREPHKALKYLSRGFKFRPDKGDSDLPYESLMPEK